MSDYLAIDFGGTRARAALFDADCQMIRRAETASRVEEGQDRALERLIALGQSLAAPSAKLAAVGIAAPGPLDAAAGIIVKAETLPGWSNVPIAAILSQAFGHVPAYVQNDGNLGALAEYHRGAGQGADPMIYLTLSTGIGGGAVIDGRLFTGAKSLAIEPGHMRLSLPDGSYRRLEELASGTALGYWARRCLAAAPQASSLRGRNRVDGQAVGEAALAGDELALRVVRQAGEWLGLGLVNLLHLFNPAAIVIGGSVINLGELILEPAGAVIRQHLLHDAFYAEGLVRPAALKEDVCLVGAALYAQWQYGRLDDPRQP